MRYPFRTVCVSAIPGLVLTATLGAASIPNMDSVRGQQVFETQGCIQCHQINGKGGKVGPNLLQVLDRSFTPAGFASEMWNHAPKMWEAINQRHVTVTPLSVSDAADLLALMYSARFFERPGDAARGKVVFVDKGCVTCHGINLTNNPKAKPVSQWQALADPVALVAANWNHSSDMWAETQNKKLPWPTLTGQEMTDLLVYLRNSSAAVRAVPSRFSIRATDQGAELFQSKGCTACHDSAHMPPKGLTLTAVAASMWNHRTFLHARPPRFEGDEMAQVLAYYWAGQFFETAGSPARGAKIFETKHCLECHAGKGPGPKLSDQAGSFSAIRIVSVIWSHGPTMLGQMQKMNIPWPTFNQGEMGDLLAFLNQQAGK